MWLDVYPVLLNHDAKRRLCIFGRPIPRFNEITAEGLSGIVPLVKYENLDRHKKLE